MGIELRKAALDVGIVTTNCEQMLAFYTGVLGLSALDPIVFPGSATIHRLVVGDSILRLVDPGAAHPAPGPGGDLFAATGFRYITLVIGNLDETMAACREFGANVPRDPAEIRPGVFAARLQDPDGNWMELQSS